MLTLFTLLRAVLFAACITFLLSGCLSRLQNSSAVAPPDNFPVSKKIYDAQTISRLRATTTVFFVRDTSDQSFNAVKKAVSEAWDLTPLVFDNYSNFSRYAVDPQYSCFSIETKRTVTGSSSFCFTSDYCYLVLRFINEVSKNGEISTLELCRIALFPDTKTKGLIGSVKTKDPGATVNKLYDQGVFYNWNCVELKGQIAAACTDLKSYTQRTGLAVYKVQDLSSRLSQDTLYVPANLIADSTLVKGSVFHKPENVFEKYKFPYRYCTDQELYRIFEEEKRGRYLFVWANSGPEKIINIYDLKEKTVVYRNEVSLSNMLKSNDIRKIE